MCFELGLNTDSYSFPCLADWSPSVQAVLEAGQKATLAAKQILAVLVPSTAIQDQQEAA